MQQLPFYFDFLSPYSYLAWQILQKKLATFEQKGLVLMPKPLAMGSLMAHYGVTGPAQIPSKRDQLWREALRLGARLNIEIKTPAKLPFNHIHLLRLGLHEVSGEFQTQVIDTLFAGIWQKSLVMEEPEVVESLLNETLLAGNAETIWQRSNSPIARKVLRQNLEEAIENGAFGVPSLVFQKELFWGVDSLISFEEILNNDDKLDRREYEKFVKLF